MASDQVIYGRLIAGTNYNYGIPPLLASILLAESKHESANYTSDVFINANNAFGYKYSGSEYQIGQYAGYAVYADLDDSAREFVDYIWRRVSDGSFPSDLDTITTPLQYATLLKNAKIGAYYQDSVSNYANGIARYLTGSDVPGMAVADNGSLVLLGLVVAALIVYNVE